MNDNYNYTWLAMCELDDYFSCLGGTARPMNMSESEIPLYIACKLCELHDAKFSATEFLDHSFIEAAKPVIEKANSYLLNVSLSSSDLIPFVTEFYEHANTKLGSDKSSRWGAFGVYLREKNA